MPIRNARLPFSIGNDITSISRFSNYFADCSDVNSAYTNNLLRFFDKVFTGPEQQLFWHRYQGLAGLNRNSQARVSATQYLAGRWAAKEAVIKAWKTRRLLMLDIEIYAREQKAPLAIVLDRRRPQGGEPNEQKSTERQALRILREWTETNQSRIRHNDNDDSEGHEQSTAMDIHRTSVAPNGLLQDKLGIDEACNTKSDVEFDPVIGCPCCTDGEEVTISLSHDGDICIAMAIAPLYNTR